MPYKYQSGEEIKKGDRVYFHEDPGEIEFVADPASREPETEWYINECGGGVMIVEPKPKAFGRVFISDTENAEDLIFVSRAD